MRRGRHAEDGLSLGVTLLHRRSALVVCGIALGVCGCNAARTSDVQLHLAAGDRALAQRQLDAALAEYLTAVELAPDSSDAHAKLGQVYKERGELTHASESLETALRLNPFSFVAAFELGEVYRLLDRLKQAVRAYVKAVELNPADFGAQFRLGSCYHRLGELDEAAVAYQAAIDLDDKSAFAWTNLGAVYDSQGKYYEAIQAYKKSLECDAKPQPIVLVNLATVYLNQERWSTARKTLIEAIKRDPNLSVAYERLGYCLWREQSMDEAAQAYLRATALDGANAAAFAGYGVVRITQYLDDPNRVMFLNEAVEAWHTSLEINPKQPKLRVLLEKYRPKRGTAPVASIDG